MREWDRQVERDAAPKRSPEGKARAKAQKAARYRAHRAKKEEASAVRKEEPSIHIIYKAPACRRSRGKSPTRSRSCRLWWAGASRQSRWRPTQ